ncbi:MAG: bifunctional biotin--[acetyl-CoA-carboxylase] ligase/biotin operon repressor BirA [Arenimonas sp.]
MKDRALLERLGAGPASGAALARELGLTRAAIWKRIEALRIAGVDIDAHPARGYRLREPLELLSATAIDASLHAVTHAELEGLEVDFEIDSTQRQAQRTPPPQHGSRVHFAERQTAGQGRRGRHWHSPLAANLYFSVARRFGGGFAALSGLSLAVGVAVAQALHASGYPQVRLKWPNDLVVDGRKLGGILIELRGEAMGPCEAVIGIGLNVRMPPTDDGIGQPWIDLAALAPPPDRNVLAATLLDHLLPALSRFDREGLPSFVPRWAGLDALAGHAVRVHQGANWSDGVALGIDASGALRVRHADGERAWHGGEVSVRDAMSADDSGASG